MRKYIGPCHVPTGMLGSLTQIGVEEIYLEPQMEDFMTIPHIILTLQFLFQEGHVTIWAYWELMEELERLEGKRR